MHVQQLKKLFQKARADLCYPPIWECKIVPEGTSEIDFVSPKYKIILGERFISGLSEKAIIGLFHHELNHWVKHPYDLKTVILETSWLEDYEDRVMIRNLFDDVIVTLDLIINKGLEEIAQIYQELALKGKIDCLLRAFYQEVTGLFFGELEMDRHLEKRLDALLQIDFLDTGRARLKNNIKQFAEIIKDMATETEVPFYFFSWEQFPLPKIKKALLEMADELDVEKYEKLLEKILGKAVLVRGLGIKAGDKEQARPFLAPDISWYETRAKRYAIYISGLEKTDSLYPAEIKDFSLEDPIETYSFIESYGQFLPGLSKRYKMGYFEGEVKVKVPDAVIAIDSSGSMKHPDRETSYAVLAAFAVARNYLEAGAKVGVINFSDKNLELFPTADRKKIYQFLKFPQRGGTTLHLEEFKTYMERVGDVDCIIITDAGIENLSPLMETLRALKQRLTFIWIKTDIGRSYAFHKHYYALKESLPPWVTFVEVEKEMDIPRIAIGKSFAAYVRDKKNS